MYGTITNDDPVQWRLYTMPYRTYRPTRYTWFTSYKTNIFLANHSDKLPPPVHIYLTLWRIRHWKDPPLLSWCQILMQLHCVSSEYMSSVNNPSQYMLRKMLSLWYINFTIINFYINHCTFVWECCDEKKYTSIRCNSRYYSLRNIAQ